MDEKGFRFVVGQTVWVRDRNGVKKATVREQHYHPDRHPFCPAGEAYALDGMLWWDCYPGCRVFATKEEAKASRVKDMTQYKLEEKYAEEVGKKDRAERRAKAAASKRKRRA